MGGVNLFDKIRGHYRVRIRSRKWYWPLFKFCLNESIVNLWIPFLSIQNSISLLEFTKQIVIALLAAPDLESRRGIRPKTKKEVPQVVRFDNKNHIVNKIETQRRCANCRKCTKFVCIKCNVDLHTCFQHFHQ